MLSRPGAFRPLLALPLVLLLGACVLLLGACGGGSSTPAAAPATTTTTVASGRPNAAALQAFRTCLAQHGVTLPTAPPTTAPPSTPPPSSGAPGSGDTGGGGFRRGGGFLGAVNLQDPATMAAFQACQSTLPPGLLQRFQQGQTARQAYRACMQSHGVTVTGPAGFGPADPTATTTPAFATANNICKALLPARGQGGPGVTVVGG